MKWNMDNSSCMYSSFFSQCRDSYVSALHECMHTWLRCSGADLLSPRKFLSLIASWIRQISTSDYQIWTWGRDSDSNKVRFVLWRKKMTGMHRRLWKLLLLLLSVVVVVVSPYSLFTSYIRTSTDKLMKVGCELRQISSHDINTLNYLVTYCILS